MLRLVMESANLQAWGSGALVLFLCFTGLMLMWIFRKGSRDTYSQISRLALDEELSGTQDVGGSR